MSDRKIKKLITFRCDTYRGYEEDNAKDFEPFLRFLPQLSYENMQQAYEESKNITMNDSHRKMMNKKSLRSIAFQVNFYFSVCE